MSSFQPVRIPAGPAPALGKASGGEPVDSPKAITADCTESPALDSRFHGVMPSPLRQGCEPFSGREKDCFLLAALTVLGSCMNSVYGVYDGVRVRPFLFVFVVAPAGSGKGSLVWARRLGDGYHKYRSALSQQARQDYEQVLATAHQNKHVCPEPPPPYKALYIPGNSSAAAFLKALAENDEWGIIFETEADTLSAALKQDWGDHSDVMRKAFHHEPTSFLRKSGERFELASPALSVVLSGTPGQVRKLIPNAENGLYSRFVFYTFQTEAIWRDISPQSGRIALDDHFADLTQRTTRMARVLDAFGPIQVVLTPDQWQLFNQQMDLLLTKALTCSSPGSSSTVYRLGLIAYRIAMILTVLRQYESDTLDKTLTCSDTDFGMALDMVGVLLDHALRLSAGMPPTSGSGGASKQQQFYEQLPPLFERGQAQALATVVGIKTRSLTNYLAQLVRLGLLRKVEHGRYRKP